MILLNKKKLQLAVNYLKQGKIIIYPTATSYGLGCDATNQQAVDRIYKIKERPEHKPLLVVVPTIEMAKEYLEWSLLANTLANKYWPGALTIVGKWDTKSKLALGVVSKDNTLALRVTGHPVPKFLSEQLSRPIVATSANVTYQGDVYDIQTIKEMYEGREFQPDVLIDGGVLPQVEPSTIVSVVGGEIKVLRQGEIRVNRR